MLDPGLGGVQVQAAVLDVLVDLLGGFQEGVLDVFSPEQQSVKKNNNANVRKEANGKKDEKSCDR